MISILMQREEIVRNLLRKLFYLGKWGGAHTSFDNLPKGFPKHIRGNVKDVAKELIKKETLEQDEFYALLGV